MTSSRTRFYLDKKEKKWAGVCAGIADYTGVDVNVVRAGFVIGALVSGLSLVIAYLVIAWLAPTKPGALYDRNRAEKKFWQQVRANPRRVARDVRAQFRDVDRRLADVEAYVTSANHRLAREIEQLR